MKELLIAFSVSILTGIFPRETDFSGKWVINKDKVEWGQAPVYVLPYSFEIKQKKLNLTIQRTVIDDKENKNQYTEEFNNKRQDSVVVSTSNSMRKIYRFQWNDDHRQFTVGSQNILADGTRGNTSTETWSLDEAGKTLQIRRDVKQADGFEYTITGYYDKQE
jgi:hypothetical protein